MVTGASGYLGRHTCSALVQAGYRVLGVVRSSEGAKVVAHAGAEAVVAGPIESEKFPGSIRAEAHAVVHLAAHVHQQSIQSPKNADVYFQVNALGTEHAAKQASLLGATVFVMAGSVAVYGSVDPGTAITESTPVVPESPYAKSKLLAEEKAEHVLQGTSTQLKVLRLPMVYGKNAPGNFQRLCKLIGRGLPLPLGAAVGERHFLYIDNFISALLVLLREPQRCPNVSLLSDDQSITVQELCEVIAHAQGKTARLFSAPKSLMRVASACIGQSSTFSSLFESMRIDNSLFRNATGWQPLVSVHQGITRAAAKAHPVDLRPRR